MPHLVIEHSEAVQFAPETLEAVHAALDAVGAFAASDLKSRFIAHRRARVGRGADGAVFVHAALCLLAGRAEPVLAALSTAIADVLQAHLRAPAKAACQLSVDVREMARGPYQKRTVGPAA